MRTVNPVLDSALNAIGIVKDVPFNLYTENDNTLVAHNPYVFDGEHIVDCIGDYGDDTLYDILYGNLTLKPVDDENSSLKPTDNENNTKYMLTSTNNTLKDLPKESFDTLEDARLAVCNYWSYNANVLSNIVILEVTKMYTCKATKAIVIEETKE